MGMEFLFMALTKLAILGHIFRQMLKCGILLTMHANVVELILCRNLFLEFGAKVLRLPVAWLQSTLAYANFQTQQHAVKLLQVRVLAYASATWLRHSASIKRFVQFCNERELNLFEATPYIVNLFLLNQIQDGISYGTIGNFLDGLAFVLRFYNVNNFAMDPMVSTMKKFAMKACIHQSNVKLPFGSAEVRTIWNALDAKYGNVANFPLDKLRTFVLAVFQHCTFCRFSDVAKITLADILHDVNYFKVHIRMSKTDQGGDGQWVIVPKSDSPFRNAHMLLCLYIHRMGFDSVDPTVSLYLFPPLK